MNTGVRQMTDEEAEKIIDEMESQFGVLPNPEHHPKQFNYYLKLYKYLKSEITVQNSPI